MPGLDMNLLLVALEECSQALVDCLVRQDPTYLEHLARRGELIRRLSQCHLPEARHAVAVRLEHCRALGVQARTAAGRMRESANRDLAAAGQDRRVADGLRALGQIQNAMLDVNA